MRKRKHGAGVKRCFCGGRLTGAGSCTECSWPIERLVCPLCGWHGAGVEGEACGTCGSRATVGCGPIRWTA